ncbi:hypothetical protein HIM_12358 [Hirsutella minnesotensis 3608]|uniref:Uncharacterized protein n=1 Tax=Hirsutella minnesotensis 3608 TaxID=1043627 RepID=A0A0F8A072_9HYPO|nr:hypothetical protein HIM_12358 [Hirsutella minnesotensis 3608]
MDHYEPRRATVVNDDNLAPQDFGQGCYPETAMPNSADRRARQKADYALALQRSCQDVVHTIQSSDFLLSNQWASPLTAAPNAISIMALCLKTADTREAAKIKVTTRKVTDETGNELGELPSQYFHTNLQHCADIGRLAFLEAEKRMNKLQSAARSIIAEGGTITYIIDLLNDVEDARKNLPGTIKKLATNAEIFKKDAQVITEKFDYWQKVIMHLDKSCRDQKIINFKQQNQNKSDADKAYDEKLRVQGEEAAAIEAIKEQKKMLRIAELDVERAQRELDALLNLPPIEEPPALEEREQAEQLARNRAAPRRDSQVYMTKAAERRESQRRMAQARLDLARENETRVREQWYRQDEKLSASHQSLTTAKYNLGRMHAEIERLGSEKIELEEIIKILGEPVRRLTELRMEVEEMVSFFSRVHTVITTTVDENLDNFLRPIRSVTDEGATVDQIQEEKKQKLLRIAFEVQGRFSATADLASTYVFVSNTYIRPGINRMEKLAAMNDADFERGKIEFRQWCNDAAEEIVRITEGEQHKMAINLRVRVEALSLRAIEAASSNDDNDGYITEVLQAAEKGHDDKVEALLNRCFIARAVDGPALLQQAIASSHSNLIKLLVSDYVNDVAQGKYSWIAHLKDEGLTADEIMNLVLHAAAQSGPWISVDHSDIHVPKDKVDVNLHQPCCAHKLRQKDTKRSTDNLKPLQEHFSRVDMQGRISLFCGLAGVFPPGGWSSIDFGRVSFSAEAASILFSDQLDSSEPSDLSPATLISQLHEAARGLTFAAVTLQQTGFCCNQFTVLTASEQGSPRSISVVHMNTIPFDLLVGLAQEIAALQQKGLNDSALSRSVSASTRIMERLSGIALPPPSTTKHRLHLCSLMVQLLCLGLMFYAQGHTGDLHPVYLAEPLNEVVVRGCSPDYPYIIAGRFELACMGDMVGGKVFAFRMSSQTLSAETGKFYLSATCEEIVDSWGPGSLILDPDAFSEEKIYGLVIRGGILKPDKRVNNGYRLFHWGGEFSKSDLSSSDTFGYRDRIVVGAATTNPTVLKMTEKNCVEPLEDRAETDTVCDATGAGQVLTEAMAVSHTKWAGQEQAQRRGQQKAREPAQKPAQAQTQERGVQPRPQPQQIPEPSETYGSTTTNIACPRNIAASQTASQSYLSELGTGPSCWKFVERGVVIQGGQYVQAQVGGTQVRQPGVPLKRALLDRWSNEGNLSQFEEPWGLQVSICTGAARRVPLRVLVRDDLMNYVGSLKIAGWERLRADAMVAMASKQQFATWSEQLKPEQWKCMQDVFGKLLMRLKDTGFDENGTQFSILWPCGLGANRCVSFPPDGDQGWCRMLKDEEWTATFAVATNLCLETPSCKCRNTEAAGWRGGKMLSTFVLPSFTGINPSTVTNHPATTWQVEHGKWYWIGKIGGLRVSARKIPDEVTELELSRNLSNMVSKLLRSLRTPCYVLVERPDVETKSEEVFVVRW